MNDKKLCKCEKKIVFPFGAHCPPAQLLTVAASQGCHSSLMTTSSYLCSNRRPTLGRRDVSAKRRGCGCAPSHPSCETWQCEGPEHLENRWVSAPGSSAAGGGPSGCPGLPQIHTSSQDQPSGAAVQRYFSNLLREKRELLSRYLAVLPYYAGFCFFFNFITMKKLLVHFIGNLEKYRRVKVSL